MISSSLTKLLQDSVNNLFIACDVSPPRAGRGCSFQDLHDLKPDIFSVSYNPGRSVRVNSVIAADWIQSRTGIDAMFTIGTRDMNKLALQSLMLGAQLNSLKNVLVVAGDEFTLDERRIVQEVNDYTPTQMIKATAEMNSRRDFKSQNIHEPTNFCIGGVFDLNKGWDKEVQLIDRKVRAGVDFLIAQPFFEIGIAQKFMDYYSKIHAHGLEVPILWGIQMLGKGSGSFSEVPGEILASIDKGYSELDLSLDAIEEFQRLGITSFYIIPPFYKGGRRDYQVAQSLMEEIRDQKTK